MRRQGFKTCPIATIFCCCCCGHYSNFGGLVKVQHKPMIRNHWNVGEHTENDSNGVLRSQQL